MAAPSGVEYLANEELSAAILQIYNQTEPAQPVVDNSHNTHPFICQLCGKKFAKVAYLKLHTRVHTGEKPYACDYDNCGKRFYDQAGLHRHQLIHKGLKPYKCTRCDKRFRQKCDMRKHEVKHMDQNEIAQATDLYRCEVCSAVFKYLGGLRAHMNVIHIKNFPCQYCNRMLSSPAALKIHTRRHTGDRPFKCKDCPKSFTSGDQLKAHRFRHTNGVKPVKCDLCDMTFITKSRMKTHRQRHRRDDAGIVPKVKGCKREPVPREKKLSCDECGLPFVLELSVKLHKELMHSDIKDDGADNNDNTAGSSSSNY